MEYALSVRFSWQTFTECEPISTPTTSCDEENIVCALVVVKYQFPFVVKEWPVKQRHSILNYIKDINKLLCQVKAIKAFNFFSILNKYLL